MGKFTSSSTGKAERPSYAINNTYPQVKKAWSYHAPANVVLTPAASNDLVIFGNAIGEVEVLSLNDGSKKWTYKTKGAIYSSPAIAGNSVVLGSGDGSIYALELSTGKLLWKFNTKAAVLGSAVIDNGVVYITNIMSTKLKMKLEI